MNQNDLDFFREHGYLILKNKFNDQFVEDLYTQFLKRITSGISSGGNFGKRLETDFVVYVDHPFTLHRNAVQIALDSEILELVSNYLNDEISVSYTESYRTKPLLSEYQRQGYDTPGVFSGWHSDANLIANNRGFRCVVCMIYLVDVTDEMGPLELIDKSHNYGGRKRPWRPNEIENYEGNRIILSAPRGSAIIFDMEMIHRAGMPKSLPRDVMRVMYGPKSGYRENLVFTNESLPQNLTPIQNSILNLGTYNSVTLPLSPAAQNGNKISFKERILNSNAFGSILKFTKSLGLVSNKSYKNYDNGYKK